MGNLKRTIHCGIDFNLMESGDKEYREACLKEWLQKNCEGKYNYEWSYADEFTIEFESNEDYIRSEILSSEGIPHKS